MEVVVAPAKRVRREEAVEVEEKEETVVENAVVVEAMRGEIWGRAWAGGPHYDDYI